MSSSLLHSTREARTRWRQPKEWPQRWWRFWSTSPIRNGWQKALFSLERTRLRADLTNVGKYLKGGCKDDELGSFQWRPVTRGNGHKPEQGRICPNIRKLFLNVTVTKNCNRLPSEIEKGCLDVVLPSSSRWPYLSRGVFNQMTSRSLPTSIIPWFGRYQQLIRTSTLFLILLKPKNVNEHPHSGQPSTYLSALLASARKGAYWLPTIASASFPMSPFSRI